MYREGVGRQKLQKGKGEERKEGGQDGRERIRKRRDVGER